MTIFGTTGDDNKVGTGGNDTFDMTQGGNDRARGLGGDDLFLFGDDFTATDKVIGGGGHDTLRLSGTYDFAFTFTSGQINSLEEITLFGTDIYRLRFNDSAVAAGASLTIDGSGLGSSGTFVLDAHLEKDGNYIVRGGAGADLIQTGNGDDVVFGGGGIDTIELRKGHDTVDGGASGDTITFVGAGAFDAGDSIDGGVGGTAINVVALDGDYSAGVVLGANTLRNIGVIQLVPGHDYDIDLRPAHHLDDVGNFIVEGFTLGAGDTVHVTAAGTHDYQRLTLQGGAGDDVLVGGNGDNDFDGGQGADRLVCGKAQDHLRFDVLDAGQAFDTLVGFDTDEDLIILDFGGGFAQGIDPAVKHGSLSLASFDADLAQILGDDKLASDHVVLVRAKQGDLAGVWFLVVDGNHTAGYQAGAEYVMRLDDPAHLANLDLGNFLLS